REGNAESVPLEGGCLERGTASGWEIISIGEEAHVESCFLTCDGCHVTHVTVPTLHWRNVSVPRICLQPVGSRADDGQTGCYPGREVRLTGNLGPGHKAPPLGVFPRSRPRTIVSPLGSGVAGPFSCSLCFAKIKLRVVQFRGFSKMTLSSLQAQAPRVILSGFSPSHCIEKTKRKPVCQVCQFRAS